MQPPEKPEAAVPGKTVHTLWEQFQGRIIDEHYPDADRHFTKLTFICGVSACLDLLLFNDDMEQEAYNALCENLVNGVQKEMMALHAEKLVEQSINGKPPGVPIPVEPEEESGDPPPAGKPEG